MPSPATPSPPPAARPAHASRAAPSARRAALGAALAATLALHVVPAAADEAGGIVVAAAAESTAADEAVADASPLSPAESETALARLHAFTTDLRSFRADFDQTLYDADSEPLQRSSGTVVLKRPGRFVWEYAGQGAQRIVADGERLWLHDPELRQVTVNPIGERVAGTPFVLLMGSAPLEEAYAVTALGATEGGDWFELVPKAAGGDFESLYVGLDEAGLAALELRDAFGQATQILFSDFEADVAVEDATFAFEVPPGTDVIGMDD